jgi:hypothetical protein
LSNKWVSFNKECVFIDTLVISLETVDVNVDSVLDESSAILMIVILALTLILKLFVEVSKIDKRSRFCNKFVFIDTFSKY